MSKWNSYIKTAEEIKRNYDGSIPLSHWLKDFFRQHKKMGSTDRKIISSVIYQYYRTCKAFSELSFEDQVVSARFLCLYKPDALLAALRPEWTDKIALPMPEKEAFLSASFPGKISRDYFPFSSALSNGIDHAQFGKSFLLQPDLFLRIRPGSKEKVIAKLEKAAVPFDEISENCFAIANQSQIDSVLDLNREAVVQDYNSQRTGEFFNMLSKSTVWDCCAASGGKSIMAYDLNPKINLTVSDIRDSILENLRQRFREAGINNYKSFKADLTRSIKLPKAMYDLVIADLPCSGSGTWSRTPEQLSFFDGSKIGFYSSLQKSILSNIASTVKSGGNLVYITCSVFREENENVAAFAVNQLGFKLSKMELLKGYEMRADSLFVAVLERG